MITLREVTKFYGRFAALRGISHEFRPGTITVVVGDNGAGKSTLLRIIGGLLKPSSGTCEVAGSVGYMAHASMLYDELSGPENLRYFATLYGVPLERARTLLAAVGLDPELKKPAREYSQGMRQRLSLARAVIHHPEIILLDEPFSNTDAASSAHVAQLLGQWRDAGKTVVVVTHQPALLDRIADEQLALSGGLLVGSRNEVHA